MIIIPAARGFLGGAKAWGPRTSITPKNGTAANTFTGLTIPAGALVALGVADQSASTAANLGVVSDSAANVWSNTGWTDNSAGGTSIFWSRLINALAAGSITYTPHSTNANCVGGMWATGPAPSPYDAAAYATNGSTGSIAPTVTSGVPTALGDLFFAMYACVSTAGVITNDPAWTSQGVINPTGTILGLAVATRINPVAGALTYTPTVSSGRVGRLNIAAFKL